MAIGLVGRKCGMTRVFQETGESVPVTVIEVKPNHVSQVKTPEIDGYSAVQLIAGDKKSSRVSKSEAGHFAKAGVSAGSQLVEFRVDSADEYSLGQALDASLFETGQIVDVTGQSKGKGFQGGVKRWNFHMQDATHGNSISHRAPGSIGQCQTPGKVWKGKKMAGHMGAEQVTAQNIEVVRVDLEDNVILVKGSVPGATGSHVVLRPAGKVKS
jgi:large subunit ribosomal protein L3